MTCKRKKNEKEARKFGTGDYHDPRGGLAGKSDFAKWGQYVMLWHDGRFMRHTRFRYWFLDTVLRRKSPGARNVFLRTHPHEAETTIQDLLDDKSKRRSMVQQMSVTSSGIAGSIGERRLMRQHLEAMVDQIESESAEAGANRGAGRLPAGFCTLTCQVFKWDQLFRTILKSYSSDSTECLEWGALQKQAPSPEKEASAKTLFYRLAHANPGPVAWYCALKLETVDLLLLAPLVFKD